MKQLDGVTFEVSLLEVHRNTALKKLDSMVQKLKVCSCKQTILLHNISDVTLYMNQQGGSW